VDFVLAEDTRRAGLLCARCHILVRAFVSFHDHNESGRLDSVLERLRRGETAALISDAGMPLLADPGYRLVRACREEGLAASVVPGPCAAVTALAGSGLPPQPCAFIGFLPRSRAEREARLAPFATLPLTLVLFERKDRLPETLDAAKAVLGDRAVCVARELTKVYEEYICGRLSDPAPFTDLRGEITVVIGPPEQAGRTDAAEVLAMIEKERPHGGAPRDIARRVQARVMGWTGKAVYALMNR
jgi:16S rRNA (cytidine1402-2'-O)-methyltransferase